MYPSPIWFSLNIMLWDLSTLILLALVHFYEWHHLFIHLDCFNFLLLQIILQRTSWFMSPGAHRSFYSWVKGQTHLPHFLGNRMWNANLLVSYSSGKHLKIWAQFSLIGCLSCVYWFLGVLKMVPVLCWLYSLQMSLQDFSLCYCLLCLILIESNLLVFSFIVHAF